MKLFTPGPTNVPEFVRSSYESDCFHHRKGEFHQMYQTINDQLKQVFQTSGDVVTLTSSGTGSMEAAVLNFFSKGDEVLVVNGGVFGARFVELCMMHELNVIEYKVEYGHDADYDALFKHISEHTKGVFMTYSETSTGMKFDIKRVGEYLKSRKQLLVVDAISGLVVNDLNMDEWGVDVCLASSQKGFLLPPGLSFVGMSQDALNVLKDTNVKSMYFDLKRYLAFKNEKSETPFTPAVFEFRALSTALDYILSTGIETIIKTKEQLKSQLIEGFESVGFIPFSKHTQNNTLVAFKHVEDIDISDYIKYMETNGYAIAGGQKTLANKIIRVGLIGDLDRHDIEGLITQTKDYFKERTHG